MAWMYDGNDEIAMKEVRRNRMSRMPATASETLSNGQLEDGW